MRPTLSNEFNLHTRWELLDLFRILAAAAVVAYHYVPRAELPKSGIFGAAKLLASFGYLGVEVFFVISGVVISLSAANRTSRSFLVHRMVRLYPSFLVALALSVLALHVLTESPPGVSQTLANATMLPGYLGQPLIDEVYWTLAVEWKFYLLVALLLAVSSRLPYEGNVPKLVEIREGASGVPLTRR